MGIKQNKSPINTLFIIFNIIFFIFIEINGSSLDIQSMLKYGAVYSPYIIEKKEYYRFLTSIFMHFGVSHLSNNMFALFLFGDNLERALGSLKYFIFYILSGVIANIISLYFNFNNNTVSAGASGAVFAVMGGLIYVLVVNKGRLEDLKIGRLTVLILVSLYYGFISIGVDNIAHLAGLFIGYILAILLYRGKNRI